MLPPYGRFRAALMQDDEAVEEMLKQPRQKHFGVEEWTPQRALLTDILDAINNMHGTLVASNSEDGKAPNIPESPRPRTAEHRIERRQSEKQHESLVAILLPNGYQDIEEPWSPKNLREAEAYGGGTSESR